MYRLVLFDLDGTLLNSDRMIIETFRELYSLYRPDYHPSDDYILTFSGPQIVDTLKKEFPDRNQKFMLSEYRERSVKNYVKYAELYPGVCELINELNEKKINFAVVTNKHRYATDYTYELFHLTGQIPFSVCADEAKHLKPAGDGIWMCMKHFGVTNPDEVIYVGDGYIDYLTAKNAGVKFGYVTWSPRHLEADAKIDLKIENYQQFLEEIQ